MEKPAIEGGIPVRKEYLSFSPPDIRGEEIRRVVEVLESGWITQGKVCAEFERALAEYTGSHRAVVLNSATAGLFLCLKIAGIGKEDEVITTPYTFAATANVILHTGAKPVFADIEENGFSISAEEIEKKITKRTRAIIPVHFGGHPADIESIKEIAFHYNLQIIEDAAHSVGAEYHGRKIGNGEQTAVFSFHAVKNLTTAEGGAVMTNDEHLAEQIRVYALHGQTRDAYSKLRSGAWKYDIAVPGYKFNMTDIQAAIGIEQLMRIEENRKKRETVAEQYTSFLKDFDFVKPPSTQNGMTNAWHLYPLIIDFSRLTIDRDTFITALRAENVSSNVHFIPVHTMTYYKKTFGYKPYDFPNAYSRFLSEVSLPLYPGMNNDDINDVREAVGKLFNYYKK